MTDANKSNPGEPFRLSREKLGLSVNDIAVATKINPRILKALEAGDREGLPANIFSRGFIRSYALYLKIDAQPILDAYNLTDTPKNPNINTDMDAPIESRTKKDESPTKENKRELPSIGDSSFKSKIFLVGGLILLIALVLGSKNIYDKYALERTLEPINVAAPTPITAETNAPETTTSTSATKTTDIEAKPEEAKPEEAKPEETKPAEPAKLIEAVAEEVKAEEVKTPVAKPAEVKIAASVPQEVILEALDSVEIKIVIDKTDSKKIKLKPESVYTIKAKSTIELDVADGGMVNIIHNGRDRGVPGDLGKPTKIKFP